MKERRIVIVGAGPGGLVCGMILAHRGFRVTIFETKDIIGGRNAELRLGDYSFDVGPTFLMMKPILDEMFEEAGRHSADYLEFCRLEPMYRLCFEEFAIDMTTDRARMRQEIATHFAGWEERLDGFLRAEKRRFERLYPCLQKDYSSFLELLSPGFLRAIPSLDLGRTVFDVLRRYFEPEYLRICFTFQSKYLGMSPWECPGAFTMLPYIEHAYGLYHVMGGLNQISRALATVFKEEGGELRTAATVRRILTEGRTVTGVELEGGEKFPADEVVINADFGHAMARLFEPGLLRKYTPERLRKKRFSCSTFMLYLGVDKVYDAAHHSIFFARDYRRNIDEIAVQGVLSRDPSFYVRNASITDPHLAPKGHSAVYVLVPVPNNTFGIDWEAEGEDFRRVVLDAVEARTPMNDIRRHIVAEEVITPRDWELAYGVYLGATFNLSHTLGQMLYFRPRNRFEELRNCWLVGGGTHPGSGLPTIFESGRISANLISKAHGVGYTPPVMISGRGLLPL